MYGSPMSETANTPQARCSRKLTAATSIAAGKGRICRLRERAEKALRGFTAAQVEKARELIEDGGIVAFRPGVFRAVSSKGDTTYLTTAAGQCSCPAAARSGRADRCYHVLSARLMTAGKAI
jgi:hypothetical protein